MIAMTVYAYNGTPLYQIGEGVGTGPAWTEDRVVVTEPGGPVPPGIYAYMGEGEPWIGRIYQARPDLADDAPVHRTAR